MIYSTITQKWQATIPVSIRKKLGLHIGSRVVFRFQGDSVILDSDNHTEDLNALTQTLTEWHNDTAYDTL